MIINNTEWLQLVEGGRDDDSIKSDSPYATIFAYEGNDTILNQYQVDNCNFYIDGGKGDDYIYNIVGERYRDSYYDYRTNGTIYGGAGNDSILLNGGYVKYVEYYFDAVYCNVNGDAGDDYISVGTYAYLNTITGGDGNDTIINNGADTSIDGGAGDDYICNSDMCVTITGGAGNDYISIGASANNITGGAGDDTIKLSNQSHVIKYASGDGNDVIEGINYTDTLQITSGSITKAGVVGDDAVIYVGNDSIVLKDMADRNLTLQLGNGTAFSTVLSEELEVTPSLYIEGTSGADNITNTLECATINALAGNDTITNTNDNVSISAGEGDDSIYNSYSQVIIQGDNGNDYIYNDNNTHSEREPNLTDEYKNYYGYAVSLNGGLGSDSIHNEGGDAVYIDGGADGDSIYSHNSRYSTIYGGNGNDIIRLSSQNNSTISGGTGNDTIIGVYQYKNSISGDDGNDIISVTAAPIYAYSSQVYESTINAGSGNDTIYNDSSNEVDIIIANIYQYANGDGNDIIFGFSANDTLQITNGSISNATVNGNDVILTVGSGKITLKDVAEQSFYLKIGSGSAVSTVISAEEENPLPNGWTYGNNTNTLLKATLATADNLDLNEDYANGVKTVNASVTSNGLEIVGNDDGNSIRAGKGADYIFGGTGNDTISLGAGADTYVYTGGNDIIQDYKAGEDVIKIATDNGIEITDVETISTNVIYTTSEGNITIKGGSKKEITLIDSDDNPINFNPEQTLYIEGNSGADYIKNTLDNATIDALAGNDTIENSGSYVSINAGAGNDVITSSGDEVIIEGDKGKDLINVSGGDNTIIGGKDNDTIYNSGSGNLYQYAEGDGKDIIEGFDENDTLQITSGSYSYSWSGDDLIVAVGTGNITLKDVADKNILLKNSSGKIETVTFETVVLPDGWKYGTSSKTNTNAEILTATIATAEKEIDLTEEYGNGVLKVDGSKVSDATITGNAENNSIKAGGGDDELDGGEGDDTLTGGKGDDIFIYSGGDDVITDYGTGTDSIQIDTNNIEFLNYEEKNSDVIYTTNEGTLTVKNAIKGGVLKNIILMDEGYNVIDYPDKVKIPTGWQFDSAKNLLKATMAGADNEIDLAESYGENVEKVDGSKISGGVEIYANDLNNSLKGGKGNDVLDGGTGNDTLTGGSGDDVFIYSGGDDVITDYVADHDSIQIEIDNLEDIEVATVGSNVVYTTDEGTLTVAKGSGKDIILMDTNDERIIINGVVIPSGWQLDTAKHILKATLPGADNEIDLNENYGDGVEKVDASKISGGVEITGNDLNNSIKGGKGNDVLDGGAGNDTLTSGAGDDVFIYSGGDDFITDYTAGKDSIQIDTEEITINDVETVGTNVIYYTDAGNLTVKSGKGKDITLVDANGDAIIIGGGTIPEGWQFDSVKKILKATVASAENEIDLAESYGENVEKVDGSKISGGVEIYGNDLDNSIKGGKGNDILDGGAGNDTLYGGMGADIFIYSGGDDFISDYAAVDAIQIDTENISITGVETVSSNVIYTTDAGNITVKGGKGKAITLIDSNGAPIPFAEVTIPEGWKYDSSKNLLQATIATAEKEIDLTEEYGENIIKVDGSKISGGVEIIGNDNGNSIKGSKGADYITGGSGNDTVSLGGGADVYVYTGGDDLIQDYANVDTIQVDTSEIEISSAETIGTNVVIETSEGNITLKGGKNKTLNFEDLNGGIIGIVNSSKNVAEDILFMDDNFISDDTNLDSVTEITQDNYSVQNIETQNYNNLTQEQNYLTFAKDK